MAIKKETINSLPAHWPSMSRNQTQKLNAPRDAGVAKQQIKELLYFIRIQQI